MARFLSNANLARIFLALTIAAFLYYFLWVSVVPFLLVDEENWIFSLFPALSYAFIFPVASGTLFISSLAAYTLYQVQSYRSLASGNERGSSKLSCSKPL